MRATETRRAETSGFSALELMVVMAIMALMVSLFVGVLLVGDYAQIQKCRSDMAKVGIVLQMYYEDTGMYPVGGIVGMVRALSYPEAGWGKPRLLDCGVNDSLEQIVEGETRYVEVVTAYTCKVETRTPTQPDGGSKTTIVRPLRTFVDPWGQDYVYLSAAEYSKGAGCSTDSAKKFDYNRPLDSGGTPRAGFHGTGQGGGGNTGFAAGMAAHRPDSYQLYSFGPDRMRLGWPTDSSSEAVRCAATDNITNWQ